MRKAKAEEYDREATVIGAEDFDEYRKVRDIIDRTNKERPKAEDVAELRRMLRASPKLWRVAGDFSEHAVNKITGDIEGTAFVVESTRAGV